MDDAIAAQRLAWHPVDDAVALREAVLLRTLSAAERAIAERTRFVIVLAGGETPRGLYQRLRDATTTDWRRWHVYFGDERCTPPDDAERNSRMAQAAWLAHVPIPRAQVHVMPAELGAREAAARYATMLQSVGAFDLVLLGLGEDGHTASLFPGQDPGAAAAAPSVLAVFAAPKPPPERVTMSARRLSHTREAIFLVSGESKREALRRWRAGAPIPASTIAPPGGVDVFVERALIDAATS